MEYIVHDLAVILRKTGIPTSTSEILDCIRALELQAPVDSYSFRTIVNACLVKTQWGEEYIERLLELYFEINGGSWADHGSGISAPVSSAMGTGIGRAGKGAPVDILTDAVFKGDIEQLGQLIPLTQLYDIPPAEALGEDVLGVVKRESGWYEASNRLMTAFRTGRLSRDEYAAAADALAYWQKLLEKELEKLAVQAYGEECLIRVLQKYNPRRVAFSKAGESMLPLMAVEVEKLAKKLAVKRGRRRRPAQKGQLDLRRTLAHSRSTGGVPLYLMKRDKKPVKPDLWLLCDLSNSVKTFSYFMLLLVYTFQKRYADIRSFIFVDKLVEVTGFLKGADWNRTLSTVGDLKGYNLTGYSHYGNVLYQFASSHLNQLNSNTTVIVLGDARNNWNKTDGREVLDDIRKKASALYWLNPMDKDGWDKEDCVMPAYVDRCTGAFQCSNIDQLELVIHSIL